MRDLHYTIPAIHPSLGQQQADILIMTIESHSLYQIHCYVGESEDAIAAEGRDCFDAFLKIRRQAEKLDWKLCCTGSRLNTWPSGMARDMGQGLVAYALPAFGEQCKGRPFSIFDPDSPDNYASVEEQEGYAKKWREAFLNRRN